MTCILYAVPILTYSYGFKTLLLSEFRVYLKTLTTITVSVHWWMIGKYLYCIAKTANMTVYRKMRLQYVWKLTIQQLPAPTIQLPCREALTHNNILNIYIKKKKNVHSTVSKLSHESLTGHKVLHEPSPFRSSYFCTLFGTLHLHLGGPPLRVQLAQEKQRQPKTWPKLWPSSVWFSTAQMDWTALLWASSSKWVQFSHQVKMTWVCFLLAIQTLTLMLSCESTHQW